MVRLVAAALLMLPLTHLSVGAIAQDEAERIKKASPDDYKKFAKLGTYTGKISGVGAKSVTFRIDDTEYQAKRKLAQALPNAAQQKAAINLLEAQFANVKWALGKEFELEFAAKVVLRKLNLPFEYDDKGNPKKYTPAEMAKLKGPGNLPGYVAKIEDFTPGASATAIFGRATKDGKPTVATLTVDNK
jgi:hypothetical protein